MSDRIAPNYIPSAEERLLLLALLGKDARARVAAGDWLDQVDFESLNEGTRRLLPMLHSRMSRWGIEHSLTGRIRGIYRRAWYVDRVSRHKLASLIDELSQLETPLVLLKGPALGLTVYDNPVHRPFSDVDVMIHPDRYEEVIGRLEAVGFAREGGSLHAVQWCRPDSPDVDLHRSPYHEAVMSWHVEPLFGRLQTLPGLQPNTFTLGAEDQLLHTLSHGERPNIVSPIRWVVDAAMVTRAAGASFDWTLFQDEVQRLDLHEAARLGLAVLDALEIGAVDRRVLKKLNAVSEPADRVQFIAERAAEGPSQAWEFTRRNARGLQRIKMFVGFYQGLLSIYGYRRMAQKGMGALRRFAKEAVTRFSSHPETDR
jgi:Uncharacterised nucleotidyltransferase